MIFIELEIRPPKKKSPASGFRTRRPRPARQHFNFFFFLGYEMMSNCSQNCWIDWNSAVLCFKRLFHIRGMNVCPICEASLSHHTLYINGKFGPRGTYMYMYFPTGLKKDYQKKKRVTAPILKPTHDQKLETFFVCLKDLLYSPNQLKVEKYYSDV